MNRYLTPRRHELVVLVCALAIALTLGALTALASATTPGRNGLIAFTRYRLQDNPLWSEIYVVSPDGNGLHRVSSSTRAVVDNHAQWSPDGTRIVFDRCTPNVCSIWMVDADGTHQHRITAFCPDRPPPACPDDSFPSFAPDGRHIVYVHVASPIIHLASGEDQAMSSEIVWRDLRSGNVTVLRRNGLSGGYEDLEVSPDGTSLSFRIENSSRGRPANGKALYVADLHGGPQQRITPWSLRGENGTWAPGGSRILFASDLAAGHLAPGTNLYAVRPDGTGLRRLTNVGPDHYTLAGSYSPDGMSIVYATDLDATPKPSSGTTFADVVSVPLTGGPVTQITHSANLDAWPTWGAATG